MEAWYALHTKPHSEIKVYQTLAARGFSTYLPMLPPRQNRQSEPLFPAYMFVQCDLEVVGLSRLEWVPGLRQILAFDGRPAIVPDDAIELIRSQLAEIDAHGGLPSHGFHPGDEVVIDGGPLRGIRGVFQGPVGPAERVQILIRFLGQANRAEVPVELLRALTEDQIAKRDRQRGTRGHGRRIHYRDRTEAAETGSKGDSS